MSNDVVIIGAGQAGFTLAQTLRQKGFADPIHLLGDEEVHPYERPPLSKGFLKGGVERQSLAFLPDDFYASKGIELRYGIAARAVDLASRNVRLADGSALSFRHLVFATGARVRRLDVPGADLAGIHYLRSLADAETLKAAIREGTRLAVLGAGFIGLEVAAAARSLGAEVMVVEALGRPMARTASGPIATAMTAYHDSKGVSFRFGRAVTAFEGEAGRLSQMRFDDGSALAADLVLIGIGVIPEIGLAAASGISCGRGIRVDALGRTSRPDVYAAGDCAEYAHPYAPQPMVIESVQNAVDQAKAVASAILGTPAPYETVPWFWSDQYDWKLQTIGIVAPDDMIVLRGEPEAGSFSVCHLREGRLVAVESLNRPRDYVQAKKPIIARVEADQAKLADPDFPLKDLC